MKSRGMLLVLVTMLLVSANARAQGAQIWSMQGSLLAASQKIGDKAINGFGFEGMVRYTPALWSVGAGFQYSSHPSGDDKIKISGFFLEPRYTILIGSEKYAPYIAGRLAFLHQTLTLGELPDEKFSSSGQAFGAGAGILIHLTAKVNGDIGGAFVRQSFSDVTENGTTVTLPGFTGYVVKAGLSFGF